MKPRTANLIKIINEHCETISAFGEEWDDSTHATDVNIVGTDGNNPIFSFDDDSGIVDMDWDAAEHGTGIIDPAELVWTLDVCTFFCAQNDGMNFDHYSLTEAEKKALRCMPDGVD
ncbi:MAG TPA: hypothetical protein H9792_01375 [Candidatus Limosilactobacillus excrementigallinarum]|nr:hypothetical protein [Candidatus Limosilactobacillus excrementigallinarum]